MTDLSIIFQNVSFAYNRSTEPLVRNLSIPFSQGWTWIVGANGVGKSTILKLTTGELNPQYGRAIIPDFARVTGKDGFAGKQLRQLEGRLSQARNKMNRIKVKKTYKMGIWMPGEKSKRNTISVLQDILDLGLTIGRWRD